MKTPAFRLTLAVFSMFGAVACGPISDEVSQPPANDGSVEFFAPNTNNVEALAAVSCSSRDGRKQCYCTSGCWRTEDNCGCTPD